MTGPQPIASEESIIREALGDRYSLERELGRGGMATVYLAEDRKHGRKVAIKVLRPEPGVTLGSDRFIREIGIAARLSHPYIVPLIDSGEANGLHYYVAAYVPGGTLRDKLRSEGKLSLDDSLRIAQEIGAALDYAHRNGYVHRDVKPENILFADDHAQLADFGVALACTPVGSDAVTAVGMALGTPEYMSPEQASGDRELGSASDIYSLGCVVFEMLAGEPPFRGVNARATMAQQVTATPRLVRTLRPDAPLAVERALARALSKDPAERQPTTMQFVSELRASESVTGRRYPTATRAVAVLPFVNASSDPENEYLSDGLTDELIDALAKVDGLRVASRTSVFALKGKPQDVRAIGALLGVSVVLEGTVRKVGQRLRITAQVTSTDDGALLWSQRYDRTLEDVFAIQDEISATIVGTLRALSFATLDQTSPKHYTESVAAYGLYLRGRFALNKRTQEGVSEGIVYFESAIAEDPNYALAFTGLADAYSLQVDYRSVPNTEGFERAKEYSQKALTLDESLPEAHASLAWTSFIYDWDWAKAEREFRRAIELNPRYAPAHQWYGFLLAAHGRTEEALVEGHTAQELDPGSVSARRSLAWLYYYARRYERTLHHLESAIAMNPTAEETYRVLGLTLAIDGQHEEAERVLREAVGMHGAGSYTSSTLGFALARGGKIDEAQSILAGLHTLQEHEYVSPVAFATLYLGLGDNARALDWSERAYDERRGWVAYVRVNPLMDPLRAEPRFAALAERMRI
jgi:serine/threonine protein kinase/Tfp pilus assembly protein PilF